MKILLVFTKENELLFQALQSLKDTCPKEMEIKIIKADKTKTKTAEEVYEEYFNSEEFTEDTLIWHPDMIAIKGWYENFQCYKDMFDVVGLKLLYPNGMIQHYGGAITKDGVGIHPHQHCLNIGLNTPQETAYVTGPGMFVKKKVWEKLKEYDKRFTYYIDVDFCFRARDEGFTIGVVPVEVIHIEGQETLALPEHEIRTKKIESHKRFISKHLNQLAKYVGDTDDRTTKTD